MPISMPIVAMVAIDLLDMAVLRLTLAPSQHHSPVGQEHGQTPEVVHSLWLNASRFDNWPPFFDFCFLQCAESLGRLLVA